MIHRRPLTTDEQRWALSALTEHALAQTSLCERAIERCVIVTMPARFKAIRGWRSAIAWVALSRRASGITLGRYVYIRAAQHDLGAMEIPLDLVVHETVHVVQFAKDGLIPFLWRYVIEYLKGRRRGLSDHAAYLAISYEVEARAVTDTFRGLQDRTS